MRPLTVLFTRDVSVASYTQVYHLAVHILSAFFLNDKKLRQPKQF